MQRADVWVKRTMERKQAKASGRQPGIAQSDQPISAGTSPGTLRIGQTVAQASLLSQVAPVYPPLAKQARISGKVPSTSLMESAVDAVRQWTYKPTLLNGEPVKVLTAVEVTFSLLS